MKKALKIVVLAKQVPDTRNVGKDAMTPEGTVNRAALPAIFNPEDLNALEMALALKDRTEGSTVHILTMGPQRAADIIRDAMFRGADGGYLLSGREFAGSDTLATSYALSCALKMIAPDIIFAGRQAIDGDTAQVGPQVAEKLGLPQVTYAEEITEIKADSLVIKRRLNCGMETVETPVPVVVTVNASAPECRPRNAKRVMTCKFALAKSEIAAAPDSPAAKRAAAKEYLQIVEWAAADVNPDPQQLADIAIQSAETAKAFSIDPKIGLLSYSTLGSGKGPDVDLVVEATSIAQNKRPDLPIVGPIQFDAAWSKTVARVKAFGNPIAGNVTVFVFPDLDAGNICYKAVQRTSGAVAIGPVLQGLNRPVNDLSRGALVQDIINTIALTAIEAQSNE